jgi:hypothetical protein
MHDVALDWGKERLLRAFWEMTITFDPVCHIYHLDGARVPSVTQVLSPLFDWDGIPAATLDRKRQIGSALDEIIILDLADDLDESTVDPALTGYLEGFRRFRADKKFAAVAVQKPVASAKYRYAGTPDAWGSLDGEDAICDWKATAEMHPAVSLQTAAYHNAACEMDLLQYRAKRYGVRFMPDGKYELVQYKDKNDFNVFLSLLSVRNWRARNGLKEKS